MQLVEIYRMVWSDMGNMYGCMNGPFRTSTEREKPTLRRVPGVEKESWRARSAWAAQYDGAGADAMLWSGRKARRGAAAGAAGGRKLRTKLN